jgi:hypothetical protein
MQGEKIAEGTGKITGRRVLPSEGAPKMETSFESTGKLLNVEAHETGTYWSVVRSDGSLFGEGQGIVMGTGGEMASWVGQGVGTLKKDGGVSYRGAIYYQTATPGWARLNRMAAIFEFEVDGQGNSRSQLWEWK